MTKQTTIGLTIEEIIKNKVHEVLNKSKKVELPKDIIETDNIGEVIEKLAILHCRMWYLEDAIGEANSDWRNHITSIKEPLD